MVKTLRDLDHRYEDIMVQTKSTSMVAGVLLRSVHYALGHAISKDIYDDELKSNSRCLIIIKMRSGLCFGLGIADGIESKGCVTHIHFASDSYDKSMISDYDKIIIVDGVINTGKSILKETDGIDKEKIIIATNVMSDQSIDFLKSYKVFTTRISDKHYTGSHVTTINDGFGPDTSDRLFKSDFFNNH